MIQGLNVHANNIVGAKIDPKDLVRACLYHGFAFAMYRLPHSGDTRIIVDLSSSGTIDQPELEEMGPGFLFAPFRKNDQHGIRLIRAHLVASVVDGTCNLQINPSLHTDDSAPLDSLLGTIHDACHRNASFYMKESGGNSVSNTGREQFTDMVTAAIAEIQKGTFQKVVPARTKTVHLPDLFDPTDFFKKLAGAYPAAMVYLVATPETGSWIGATPELLLSIDKDQVFSTSALAGTQPYKASSALDDAAWKQKEIEEQAMVSRYIINCFKRIRLREFDEIGPRTVKAGNLLHLETRFSVNMQEVHYPQLGSVMLELLHPTSATCGMPKEPAMDFLRQREPFDRAYFSGYLGPVHLDNETWIFVNLRCMQLLPGNKGMLYSGAGVTAHSDPEKEWIETRLKMKTLKDLLRAYR
jgi:isochorismate synthase